MWSITGTQSDKSFKDKLKIHSQLLLSPREDPLSQDDPVQGLQTKTSSLKSESNVRQIQLGMVLWVQCTVICSMNSIKNASVMIVPV